jgi:prepilin-type N-terminal cleavage/methylation domain-containing protein
MAAFRSKRAFSLIELMIVISVIAAIVSVGSWYVFGVLTASKGATDNQNVNTWNSSYSNVIAAQPSFATDYTTWLDASNRLATGVEINVSGTVMTIKAPKPSFLNDAEPGFTPGKGITSIPTRE